MNLNDLDESLRSENPCWKGYKPVGTKKKGGRTVPNCVPESNEGVAEGGFDNASPMTKDTVKSDRIRSLKNLIAIAKEQGRQLRVQELELELKKLQGVAEGMYAGTDDTVGFSVNSERAYQAVMSRFGDQVDHDETSGIMYVPARMWPQVEVVAFDADGEGATREDSLEESNGFHAVLSFTDGSQQGMRLANPSNSVKQVLSYLIRSRNIDSLKRLVSIDGVNVKNIVSQLMSGPSNQVNLESRVANMNNTINRMLEAAEKIGGRHAPADFDAMVGRVGQQAKQGPMRTVWDPVKRVYKVVPVNKK